MLLREGLGSLEPAAHDGCDLDALDPLEPGDVLGAEGAATGEGDLEGLQTMRTLANNMVFLMRSIALGKEKYGLYHEKVLKDYGEKYEIIPLTDEQYVEVDDNGYSIR